jgi:hypothetical protein
MKPRFLLLMGAAVVFTLGAALAAKAPPPKSRAAAERFVAELSKQSPEHDEAPIRKYEIRDLDADDRSEVLEYISAYEEAAGFLNDELEPAFDWVNVYQERNGQFSKATGAFPSFLKARKTFYESWLKTFEHPSNLSLDSQGLINANIEDFQRILQGYIRRIQSLVR